MLLKNSTLLRGLSVYLFPKPNVLAHCGACHRVSFEKVEMRMRVCALDRLNCMLLNRYVVLINTN